jgi:hypothetical protein
VYKVLPEAAQSQAVLHFRFKFVTMRNETTTTTAKKKNIMIMMRRRWE